MSFLSPILLKVLVLGIAENREALLNSDESLVQGIVIDGWKKYLTFGEILHKQKVSIHIYIFFEGEVRSISGTCKELLNRKNVKRYRLLALSLQIINSKQGEFTQAGF